MLVKGRMTRPVCGRTPFSERRLAIGQRIAYTLTMRHRQTNGKRWSQASPGVMFLINDLGIGGAERALVDLVNNSSRVRPVIGVLRPVLDLASELDPDIEVVCVEPTATGRLNGRGFESLPVSDNGAPRGRPRGQMTLELPGLLRTSRQLARAVRATRCSVVSTFLNRAHTVALTARLFFARDLRVVVNVHVKRYIHGDRRERAEACSAGDRPRVATSRRHARRT